MTAGMGEPASRAWMAVTAQRAGPGSSAMRLVLQTLLGRTVALPASVRMVGPVTRCQEPAAVPQVSVEPTVRMAAPRASTANTVVRNATVLTGAGATASMGPASVTQGSMAVSATLLALPGPLDRAVLRTAFVSSHTQDLVTRRMAAAPARLASRASAARPSASQASLDQAAETVAPAGQVWPVTL